MNSEMAYLEILVFEEMGRPEKNLPSRSRGKNQQQTYPTDGFESGNRTWGPFLESPENVSGAKSLFVKLPTASF